jgi:small-conductance mechanosensitive channel
MNRRSGGEFGGWAARDLRVLDFTGPHGALTLFGVRLVGVTPENGRKLLVTLGLLVVASVLGWLLTKLVGFATARLASRRVGFWTRQGVSLFTALVVIVGTISIWFDDPTRLTTAAGLVTAGVAVAMQRVITAIAGYFLILRGSVFNVGDRIVIGGVRGDVAALGLLQTTIMEMGESGPEQSDAPALWVKGRQYTGRLVTVSNAAVFEKPVYNYSRDFPFLFEEIALPVRYEDDWAKAEAILLDAARRHTEDTKALEQATVQELNRRYFLHEDNAGPRVYWRITDNWLELSVRFVVRDHSARAVKDAMSRDILAGLKAAGIGVASGTYAIVQVPPLEVKLQGDPPGA